jgi:two-component system LytT family response regulator
VIRSVIVDDERLARERIRQLLEGDRDVSVVAEASGGSEAVDVIRDTCPSLLFLDVQMPELDGFGVLQQLHPAERPKAIIFVTAYDRYAVDAFDVNAVDYLLKPVVKERFASALERARGRLALGENAGYIESLLRSVAKRASAPDKLPVKSRDGVQFVAVNDIDWLEADRNYVVLHVGTVELRLRETITELEERLNLAGFVRVHRSVLLNADRIMRIEPWANGEYVVVMRNGKKINTGRGYGEKVRALFS